MTHPLDKKVPFLGGEIPEENYHRRVWSSLIDIMSEERKISEKDFKRQDELQKEADQLVKSMPNIVDLCIKKGTRPRLCAELVYETHKKGKPIFAESKNRKLAESLINEDV